MKSFNISERSLPSISSNAPHLIKLITLSLVTTRLVTRFKKSLSELNGLLFIISLITGSVTLQMPFKPYNIELVSTFGVKLNFDLLISGKCILHIFLYLSNPAAILE